MAHYSFVVVSPHPIGITQPLVILDGGVNAFNVVVDDLPTLLDRFKEEGVEVKQMNRLDEHEPVKPADLLLDGETVPPLLGEGHEFET